MFETLFHSEIHRFSCFVQLKRRFLKNNLIVCTRTLEVRPVLFYDQ
jgi:hypothetical protein